MSVNLYTNILIIVSFNLMIFTKYVTLVNIIILLIMTLFTYIIFLSVVEQWTKFNSVGTMKIAFFSPILYFGTIFIGGFCALIDYLTLTFFFIFKPTTATILQTLYKERGVLNDEENLPMSIMEKLKLYNASDDKEIDDGDRKTDVADKNNLQGDELSGEYLIKKDKKPSIETINVKKLNGKKANLNEENKEDNEDNCDVSERKDLKSNKIVNNKNITNSKNGSSNNASTNFSGQRLFNQNEKLRINSNNVNHFQQIKKKKH